MMLRIPVNYVSLDVTRCHYVSLYVTRCHSMSLGVTRCHQVSLNVTRCHSMSLGVTLCHQVSLDVTRYYTFSLSAIDDILVQVYLEDSLGERVWVDRADCKPLVDNIITAFGTKSVPKNPALVDSLSFNVAGSASEFYCYMWLYVCFSRVIHCNKSHVFFL